MSFVAVPICHSGKWQAILAEFRSSFHLQSCQDKIPIEDTLQGGKEMCVKTEWQQYFEAQTQDYFIGILSGNSWFYSLSP